MTGSKLIYCHKTLTKHNMCSLGLGNEININISYGNKPITGTHSTKFLGLIVDNIISWKNHTDQFMSKLSNACYAIRAVKSFMSHKTLRMIYFSYVHSIMTYSIIFGGNSTYSSNIFKFQTRIISHYEFSKYRRYLSRIRKLNILSLQSQCRFSLLIFMIKNRDLYNAILRFMVLTSDTILIYIPPTSSLTVFQKGAFYF